MKRQLRFLAFLLLAIAPGLGAQASATLGVELGYGSGDVYGSGAGGTQTRSGAVAGAYFRLSLTRWLAVQPGLLIASKGGGATILTAGARPAPLRTRSRLPRPSPLLLRARIPTIAGTKLVLLAGAVPGWRIGCNVAFTRREERTLLRGAVQPGAAVRRRSRRDEESRVQPAGFGALLAAQPGLPAQRPVRVPFPL